MLRTSAGSKILKALRISGSGNRSSMFSIVCAMYRFVSDDICCLSPSVSGPSSPENRFHSRFAFAHGFILLERDQLRFADTDRRLNLCEVQIASLKNH